MRRPIHCGTNMIQSPHEAIWHCASCLYRMTDQQRVERAHAPVSSQTIASGLTPALRHHPLVQLDETLRRLGDGR